MRCCPSSPTRTSSHSNVDTYRVAVVEREDRAGHLRPNAETTSIRRRPTSRPAVSRSFRRAWTTARSFDAADDSSGCFNGPSASCRAGGPSESAGTDDRPATSDFPGRWRLLVQHQSGSLEAAVAGARKPQSRTQLRCAPAAHGQHRAADRHLAPRAAARQQQMEFVAGVSHELRTPVAVIKSAAENLSQGVVGNAERVKRYGQMIEGEARRLGEMVERVLQYAGIESGLGYGARTSLAPAEIIESADRQRAAAARSRHGHHPARHSGVAARGHGRRRGAAIGRAEPRGQRRQVRRARSLGGHQGRARARADAPRCASP